MSKEIIEKYIENVLHKRLKEFEVKEKYIIEIEEDIREQMYSLFHNWNNEQFRKAILVTAIEEGKFYEPEAELDIKCFVVVAIRNSKIEQIFSDESYLMELDKPIDEKFVKTITQEAIEYFKDVDFKEVSNNINKLEIKDRYGEIVKKYPVAWNALVQLGGCTEKKRVYEKKVVEETLTLEQFKISENSTLVKGKRKLSEVQSGINESFTQGLIEILEYLTKNEKNIFYVDCFKMITRNFEKLLKILEILLENGDYFLTSNFLITDSYIGKRSDIYRAAHNEKEVNKKIRDEGFLFGISKFHRTVLKEYVDKLLENM